MGNKKKIKNLELVRNLFNQWNKYLKSKSAKTMASFYSDDCSFLPTLNKELKRWKEWAKEYFEHFLEKNPIWKIIEDEVHEIGNDTYVHHGLYDFEVDWGEKGKRKIAKARFTYIWKKNDEKYEIIHHHSSLKPTK